MLCSSVWRAAIRDLLLMQSRVFLSQVARLGCGHWSLLNLFRLKTQKLNFFLAPPLVPSSVSLCLVFLPPSSVAILARLCPHLA